MFRIKRWNNKASDITLVYLYSTIKMMHGPINVRFWKMILIEWKGLAKKGRNFNKICGLLGKSHFLSFTKQASLLVSVFETQHCLTLIISFHTEVKHHCETADRLMRLRAKVHSLCRISWDCFVILHAWKSNFLGGWGGGLRPPMSNFKGQQENLFSLILLTSAAFKRRNSARIFNSISLCITKWLIQN